MKPNATAYSFRNDPNVPAFAPPEHFTVMDAQCGLCAKGAFWIARHDRERKIRIVPMQSELGRALLQHYGMSPDDPLSWLYVQHGQAYTSLDAIVRVGQKLGGIWRVLNVFRVLPRSWQDRLYGVVARNRYRFFGRKSFCDMPAPEVQDRIIN